MIKFSSTITVDKIKGLVEDLKNLTEKQVLVGVPESDDARKGEPIGNAVLAYIHDTGSPVRNIPARPFMEPGIKNVQNGIDTQLRIAAKASIDNNQQGFDFALNKAGMIAMSSIKKTIVDGEDFEPLKIATKKARLNKRKYLKKLDKEAQQEIMEGFKPLIDTGELLNSIRYVIKTEK